MKNNTDLLIKRNAYKISVNAISVAIGTGVMLGYGNPAKAQTTDQGTAEHVNQVSNQVTVEDVSTANDTVISAKDSASAAGVQVEKDNTNQVTIDGTKTIITADGTQTTRLVNPTAEEVDQAKQAIQDDADRQAKDLQAIQQRQEEINQSYQQAQSDYQQKLADNQQKKTTYDSYVKDAQQQNQTAESQAKEAKTKAEAAGFDVTLVTNPTKELTLATYLNEIQAIKQNNKEQVEQLIELIRKYQNLESVTESDPAVSQTKTKLEDLLAQLQQGVDLNIEQEENGVKTTKTINVPFVVNRGEDVTINTTLEDAPALVKSFYESQIQALQQAVTEYQNKLQAYENGTSGKDQIRSNEVKQSLQINDEPNATITVSNVNQSAGQTSLNLTADQVRADNGNDASGYTAQNVKYTANGDVVNGNFLTVTYDNLSNSSYGNQKIAKIIVTFSDLVRSPNELNTDNQPALVVWSNPYNGFWYDYAQSVTATYQFYDENGQLINLSDDTTKQAWLAIGSLNSSTGRTEKVTLNSDGTAYGFVDSSVTVHNGRTLYSDGPNVADPNQPTDSTGNATLNPAITAFWDNQVNRQTTVEQDGNVKVTYYDKGGHEVYKNDQGFWVTDDPAVDREWLVIDTNRLKAEYLYNGTWDTTLLGADAWRGAGLFKINGADVSMTFTTDRTPDSYSHSTWATFGTAIPADSFDTPIVEYHDVKLNGIKTANISYTPVAVVEPSYDDPIPPTKEQLKAKYYNYSLIVLKSNKQVPPSDEQTPPSKEEEPPAKPTSEEKVVQSTPEKGIVSFTSNGKVNIQNHQEKQLPKTGNGEQRQATVLGALGLFGMLFGLLFKKKRRHN